MVVFCVAIFVHIFFVLSRMSSPAAAAAIDRGVAASGPSTTGGRWKHPCDAETPLEPDESYEPTTGSNADNFAELSRMVTTLKEPINSLKNRYVLARFGNASYAEQSINLTAPNSFAPKWNLTNASNDATLQLCYENLARLVILTNASRQGESGAEVNNQFATDFAEIEEHASRGLYVIMCELNIVMSNLRVQAMSNETAARLEAISLPTPSNEAQRYLRDYYVLRLLEISADKLTAVFDHFVGRYREDELSRQRGK